MIKTLQRLLSMSFQFVRSSTPRSWFCTDNNCSMRERIARAMFYTVVICSLLTLAFAT